METASSIEEALVALIEWWNRQPTLVTHEFGNLILDLDILGTHIRLEVTDPNVLDALHHEGPLSFINYLVDKMGIPEEDARAILEQCGATVEVDTLRVPSDPTAWSPEAGLDATDVMPQSVTTMYRALLQDIDVRSLRDTRRARSVEGRRWLESLVRSQRTLGLSDAQVSKETGIPRSTLRDTRERLFKAEKTKEKLGEHKRGKKWTPDQVDAVLSELASTNGNSAEVSRRLGVPERTVRDLKKRTEKEVKSAPILAKRLSPKALAKKKMKVIELVKEGMTATAAARKAKVAERTARDWVRKERWK